MPTPTQLAASMSGNAAQTARAAASPSAPILTTSPSSEVVGSPRTWDVGAGAPERAPVTVLRATVDQPPTGSEIASPAPLAASATSSPALTAATACPNGPQIGGISGMD